MFHRSDHEMTLAATTPLASHCWLSHHQDNEHDQIPIRLRSSVLVTDSVSEPAPHPRSWDGIAPEPMINAEQNTRIVGVV